jgi:hypothetical protein
MGHGTGVIRAEVSARAEISAAALSARNLPSLCTSIKSFANIWLTIVKARGTLVVTLPVTSMGEVNSNHAPSYN